MNLLGLYWRAILPLGLMWSGMLRQTVLSTAFYTQ